MRWMLLLSLCFACDDGAIADEPEAVDARGSDAVVDAGVSTDDAGSADASMADVPIMGDPDASLFDCPDDDEQRHTVRFTVRNVSAESRFLPVQGDLCAPFVMRDAGGAGVERRVANVCSAECACLAGTPLSWATRYVELAPGETHTFEWDAQYTERCEREVYCPEFEGRGRNPRFNVARPVWRNAPSATTYTIELAFEAALPDGCDDPMTCQGPSGMHWFGRCEAGHVSETEFVLGAAAETTVEIELP